MKRRTFLKNTAGAAALGPIAKAQVNAVRAQATSSTHTNIVLIVCDDLGHGDLNCYGSDNQTPNVDMLAEEGVLFRQFYSGNPVCSPSRAAILTGRYGVRSGVNTVFWPTDTGGLATNEVTIAQMLKPAGYKTMCVGKWHLGLPPQYLPTSRGFDHYYGIPYSNDMSPSILMQDTTIIETPVNLNTLTQRYTTQAVNFINSAANGPFFLYMAHTFPHIPLACSTSFTGKSGMGMYGDVIQEIDWSVGVVLQALEANGLDQNTLVMFTSDHGPWYQGSTGGLRGRKGDTFDGGMHTPFIARFPGHIPTGASVPPHGNAKIRPSRTPAHIRTVDMMATALDLLPTIAGFVGVRLPPNPLDGVDIGPVLRGHLTTVTRPPFFFFNNWDLQCARMGAWKLHVSRGNVPAYTATPAVGYYNLRLINPELYNIDDDPDESRDVSKLYPAIVTQIQQEIAQALLSFPTEVQSAWATTQSIPVNPNEPGSYPTPIIAST
jgi:arylsulfatase A